MEVGSQRSDFANRIWRNEVRFTEFLLFGSTARAQRHAFHVGFDVCKEVAVGCGKALASSKEKNVLSQGSSDEVEGRRQARIVREA